MCENRDFRRRGHPPWAVTHKVKATLASADSYSIKQVPHVRNEHLISVSSNAWPHVGIMQHIVAQAMRIVNFSKTICGQFLVMRLSRKFHQK
jgi:hypothetical protein